MSKKSEAEEQIKKDAVKLAKKEKQLALLEKRLSEDEGFKSFIQLQAAVKTQDALFRESVKNEMIKYGIKTIPTEWATITLVEPKPSIKVKDADLLPDRLKKLVPDTQAIGDEFLMTNILPPGTAMEESTKYIKVTRPKEKK